MIELLYLASQVNCGATPIDISVNVYHNAQLIKTLLVNERVLLPVESVNQLTFEYSFDALNCSTSIPTEMTLSPDDAVPNLPGAYDQQSIQEILAGLNDYEELFLVELGTTDTTHWAYDLQDVMFIIDNNPTVFAD